MAGQRKMGKLRNFIMVVSGILSGSLGGATGIWILLKLLDALENSEFNTESLAPSGEPSLGFATILAIILGMAFGFLGGVGLFAIVGTRLKWLTWEEVFGDEDEDEKASSR